MENRKETELENLENVTGGTPKSIPGGKHSGRWNTEKMQEIFTWLGDQSDSLQESLGMKQKRVNNKIYDRTIKMD